MYNDERNIDSDGYSPDESIDDTQYNAISPMQNGTYSDQQENQTYQNRFYQDTSYTTSAAEPREKKRRNNGTKGKGALKAAGIVALCAVFSIASGIGTFLYMDHHYGDSTPGGTNVVIGSSVAAANTDSNSTASSLDAGALSASQIYDLSCEQVVGISTSFTTTNVFGQTSSYATSGSGCVRS